MLYARTLFFLSPCLYFLQLDHKCFRNVMGGVWEMAMKAGMNADLPSPYFLANVIFFFLQVTFPLIPSMTRVKEVVQDEGRQMGASFYVFSFTLLNGWNDW